MSTSFGQRLEEYTRKCPEEVLIVTLEVDGDMDEVMIFKGFSSSLMRPTNFDPDIPIITTSATIMKIDRAKSPYNPDAPSYIQQGLTQTEMEYLLSSINI